MEKKINEVHDYFKNKLVKGEFEIKEISEYKAIVVVDKKYEFCVWTGNYDIPTSRKMYKHEVSYMDIELSDSESCELDKVLKPSIKAFRLTYLISQKENELNELKKQLI